MQLHERTLDIYRNKQKIHVQHCFTVSTRLHRTRCRNNAQDWNLFAVIFHLAEAREPRGDCYLKMGDMRHAYTHLQFADSFEPHAQMLIILFDIAFRIISLAFQSTLDKVSNFSRYIHVPTHTQINQIDLKENKHTYTLKKAKVILRSTHFRFRLEVIVPKSASINRNLFQMLMSTHGVLDVTHWTIEARPDSTRSFGRQSPALLKQFSVNVPFFYLVLLAKNIESICEYLLAPNDEKVASSIETWKYQTQCICLSSMCGCYFHSKYQRNVRHTKEKIMKNKTTLHSFPLIYSIFLHIY